MDCNRIFIMILFMATQLDLTGAENTYGLDDGTQVMMSLPSNSTIRFFLHSSDGKVLMDSAWIMTADGEELLFLQFETNPAGIITANFTLTHQHNGGDTPDVYPLESGRSFAIHVEKGDVIKVRGQRVKGGRANGSLYLVAHFETKFKGCSHIVHRGTQTINVVACPAGSINRTALKAAVAEKATGVKISAGFLKPIVESVRDWMKRQNRTTVQFLVGVRYCKWPHEHTPSCQWIPVYLDPKANIQWDGGAGSPTAGMHLALRMAADGPRSRYVSCDEAARLLVLQIMSLDYFGGLPRCNASLGGVPQCIFQLSEPPKSGSSGNIAIGVGAFVGIIFIGICAVVIYKCMFRKKLSQSSSTATPTSSTAEEISIVLLERGST